MKLYLAAVYTSNYGKKSQLYLRHTPAERYYRDNVRHILESYHYIHRQRYVESIRADGCKVFLDSGAFSAYSKGVQIDLPGYCDYIKKSYDIIECVDGTYLFSVLDGIGDPLKTYQNQLAMEALGVRPLPCFHYGEDERYLEWYIKNYDYITIGGMVPITTPQLYLWLDRIFDRYLTDGAGRPRLKVHGFGLTTIGLMERYPWYSVDSSSWVQIAANGGIWHPDVGAISVSKNSPSAKEANRHLDTIPKLQRDAVVKELVDRGFEIERLQTDYLARWAFNCWSFTELNDRTNRKNKTFKPEQPLLF